MEKGAELSNASSSSMNAASFDMFPAELHSKVGQLKVAIDELASYLQKKNMDCYFLNLLGQLSQLSRDVDCRLEEVSTFLNFLSSHRVPTTSTGSGYFSLLPDELLVKILSFLDAQELSAVSSVNQQWRRLSEDESLWKCLYFRRWRDRQLGPRQSYVSEYFTLNCLDLAPATSTPEEAAGVNGHTTDLKSTTDAASEHQPLHAPPAKGKGSYNSVVAAATATAALALSFFSPSLSSDSQTQAAPPSSSSLDLAHSPKRDQRKRTKRYWKNSYIRRGHTETNWAEGRCKVQSFPGHTSTRVRCLQFDETKLAMGSFDQKCVRVLDFQTRESLQELVGHTGGVMSLRFDRNILLSTSRDRTVKMWDMSTGANVSTFTEHLASVWCLDWDGGFNCVSGSEDRLVKLWDLKSGKCIHSYSGHTKGIGSITFDSRYVASGSRDKTTRLWDQRMRKCLHTYRGHTNSVRCLRFDKRILVSGSWDNTIKIWDLVTGEQLKNLNGHTDRVLTLQFDDYKIVSGSFDQTIKIWNIDSGVCQHTLSHDYPLAHLQFDESKIISGSRDLTVKIWNFS